MIRIIEKFLHANHPEINTIDAAAELSQSPLSPTLSSPFLSRVEHGLGLVELREKFYLTELNRIEKNLKHYRLFIMYKLFEIEVNGL